MRAVVQRVSEASVVVDGKLVAAIGGENEAAKEEFGIINRLHLPEAVSEAIDDYLATIDIRLAARKRRIANYIEAAFGYDSNVNSATDSSTIAIPAFGNLIFTLGQKSDE